MSDVVEKTSTRRRSRIPCVVVEKITTRRREGVGGVVEKFKVGIEKVNYDDNVRRDRRRTVLRSQQKMPITCQPLTDFYNFFTRNSAVNQFHHSFICVSALPCEIFGTV